MSAGIFYMGEFCLEPNDPFLDEKAIWIATISDGNFSYTIYQDDDRPGYEEPSTWVRLGQLLKFYPDFWFTSIKLKFRDHIVPLPMGNGYYFSRAVMGELNGDRSHGFFIFGVLQDRNQELLECKWYHLPTLEVADVKYKNKTELVEPFVIWRELDKPSA